MAVLTGGAVYVPNPTPQTLRYGLFTVAVGPMDLPDHAADSGVTWESAACGTADGFEIVCIDSLVDTEKGPFDPVDFANGTPFSVVTGHSCFGLREEDRRRLVMERLQAAEQAAVENIFSEGTFGQSPSLANNATPATELANAGSLTEAFSLLEESFYETYHYPGVIHLPFAGGAYAMANTLMQREGRIWRTSLGTAVSIGNYANLGPAGEAPAAGSVWVYITPPIAIWRSNNVFIAPIEGALDRTSNEVSTYAEREYVLAHDPCPVYTTEAVLVEAA